MMKCLFSNAKIDTNDTFNTPRIIKKHSDPTKENYSKTSSSLKHLLFPYLILKKLRIYIAEKNQILCVLKINKRSISLVVILF